MSRDESTRGGLADEIGFPPYAVAHASRANAGVQWAVILGVIVLLATLMTIFWQGH